MLVPTLIICLLLGCARPAKVPVAPARAFETVTNTVPLTEARAIEIATAKAEERGWKGPFGTQIFKDDVQIPVGEEGQYGYVSWGTIIVVDKGEDPGRHVAILRLNRAGRILGAPWFTEGKMKDGVLVPSARMGCGNNLAFKKEGFLEKKKRKRRGLESVGTFGDFADGFGDLAVEGGESPAAAAENAAV